VARKWECKEAPVEGGRRGIQVQREEQVGHGLHNVSTWLEQNIELEHKKKEIIPFILKRTERKNNQTKENFHLGRKKQKARTFKQKKTFNLGTKEQSARTIKQKKLFNLSRTEAYVCVCLREQSH